MCSDSRKRDGGRWQTHRVTLALLSGVMAFASACQEEARPAGSSHLGAASPPQAVRTSEIVAGPAQPTSMVGNPYVENAYVMAEGKRLYAQFNCAGCHGMHGGGGMGPPLADADWIYGSDPVAIHQSIRQGRPNGMPSFASISDEVAWKIVAYVRSLDATLTSGGVGDQRDGDETPDGSGGR
jgi:cytochrome c oxidase cbb3-type subunit III